MHFLGLAGIFNILFNNFHEIEIWLVMNFKWLCFGSYNGFNDPQISILECYTSLSLLSKSVYYGPHIDAKSIYSFLGKPVRVYMPNLDRNKIGLDNKNRTIIYCWLNLINAKCYVGSGWQGASRLISYFRESTLLRNRPIYNSISKYTHKNFMLYILEDLGITGSVTKKEMLLREKFYLDIIFALGKNRIYNYSPTAGTTLGYKHSLKFIEARKGKGNPMYGRTFSPVFLAMQKQSKVGHLNPQFGRPPSPLTLDKLRKMIYVYDFYTKTFIGSYPTVKCSSHFAMGKDTLTRCLNSGNPFKGLIFLRKPIK